MGFLKTYQRQEQSSLKQSLAGSPLIAYTDDILRLFDQGWARLLNHGDFLRWRAGFESLPENSTADMQCSDVIQVGSVTDTVLNPLAIETALQALRPWRKGPFALFGVYIDTEWRSDWKWQRVVPHISPLQGRRVLDIGCGSGYHLWRMWGEGADLVVGIDPTPLFSLHFASIKRYQPQAPVFLVPTGIDEMPESMCSFDTVFSMGILYHRREPLAHLIRLKELLKDGGELVLETLVVDGNEQTCLMPHGRYAKMRNVWFIPSVAMLKIWLERVGFFDVRCVDLNTTSIEEQRVTPWMTFESLASFLDPDDLSKTIEGYPAPQRAVMLARA